MRVILLAVLIAILQGCAAPPGRMSRQPDSLCVDDCLGTGGTKEFCQSRCSD